ncbi:MAG: VF530 family DNA-binding protein [Nitrospirales bacterium]
MGQPSPISHPRDPFHGIMLKAIVANSSPAWVVEMRRRIPVRCFLHEPSMRSSLQFLRKRLRTPQKVALRRSAVAISCRF